MSNIEILLGTHNGAKFLNYQIESILSQSYTNWKLLVHDDNSTDRTVDILRHYASLYPNKIIFIDDNLSFGNASKNFAFLLENATADYIMFCDQDDIWLPNKIELTLKKMQEIEKTYINTPILVHTDLKVVDQNLAILSDSYWSYQGIDPKYDTLNRLLIQNIITGCTMMINRQLAQMALPIPKDVIMHDWWIGLVASAFGKIVYIDKPLIFYRQHANNDTGAKRYSWQYIISKLIAKPSFDKYIQQSSKFLETYKKKLNQEQYKLLQEVQQIPQMSWIDKRKTIIKYKIFKNGFARNIGTLLFI